MTFKLDTSGAVSLWNASTGGGGGVFEHTHFDDLPAFTQGYVEGLLRELNERLFKSGGYTEADFFGFRHLAPETLARIMADCEACRAVEWLNYQNTVYDGRLFWEERQKPDLGPHNERFPPLTPYFGDDGLIYLREAKGN